ncbi:MAG: type II toxin-antitoxin system VapC family toxin [Sporichthyaceae bacterium]
MILVDTGPLVAAADTDDDDHRRCVDLLTGLRLASRPLLISPLVVAEVSYMIGRDGGSPAEAAFISSIRNGDLTLVDLLPADLDRMVELLDTYEDLRLGAADASVVAIAERLNISDIATLDRRHFTVVRPDHVPAFTLLP